MTVEKEATNFANKVVEESEKIAEETFNKIMQPGVECSDKEILMKMMVFVGVINDFIQVLGQLSSVTKLGEEERQLMADSLEGAFSVLSESLKKAEQSNNQNLV